MDRNSTQLFRGRHRGSGGFSVLELMIVLAIVALLVSIATPAYQDFTIRARAAEGFSVAGAAKLAVEESCQTDPAINISTQSGYSFHSSNYVQSVDLFGNCSIIVIAIRTQNTGAEQDPLIWLYRRAGPTGNKFFDDIFSQSGTWSCFGWPNAAHLPSTCRVLKINS